MESAVAKVKGNKNAYRNRKRKSGNKRFLDNAKGFGKKGNYGKGTEIANDQFTYFINILDSMKTGFESIEDKVTMADNVFEQTVDKEIHLSSNQVVSKAIESLIGFTSPANLEKFLTAFGENLRPICSNNYASHVLQKMIDIAFLRAVGQNVEPKSSEDADPPAKKAKESIVSEKAYNTTTEFSENHRQTCSEFVLKISKFLLNNLEDFVWDPYGNHIMRTCISCLGGIHSSKVAFDHLKKQAIDYYNVPQEWKNICLEYVNRLKLWPQFKDFPYDNLSSGLMQSICTSLKRIDEKSLKELGNKLLLEAFLKTDEDDDKKSTDLIHNEDNKEEIKKSNFPKVFQKQASVRLLETLLTVAKENLITQIYTMLFKGHLKILAFDNVANFAVKNLIEHVKGKEVFESIFDELSNDIEELLKLDHTNVVYSLSCGCLRLSTKQGPFITALQNALHTSGSKEKQAQFFKCLLKLKPLDVLEWDKSQFIHFHGTLIIQNILQYNKPIFLVNCIFETPSNELATIFSSMHGSHIVDDFLKSKFIGEKSREKLIRHLEGTYIEMAGTKYGSYIVENLFEASSDGQKCKIAKELASKKNQLKATLFGRVVWAKLRLDTFCLSESQWKASLGKADKAEKLFKDILKK